MGLFLFLVDLLFTEVADGLPVVFVDGEPLAVSRADVDVHRAEVVVFLVACSTTEETWRCVLALLKGTFPSFNLQEWVPPTWRSAPRNLHVQLDRVHAQDGVSHVAQHVPAGRYAHEGRQLLQLLELRLPPAQAKQLRLNPDSRRCRKATERVLTFWDQRDRCWCQT